MKYAVVYSSNTGNTALLARRIGQCIPADDLCMYETPSEEALKAEMLFVGFWTDRGSCDEKIAGFLQKLRGKKVFLFGTAGFGKDAEYFAQIISRVSACLDDSNELAGSYMCQGKMPVSVRRRYEAMLEDGVQQAGMLLDNFDKALTHPDEEDLKRLQEQVGIVVRA